jgi:branched-chain amino acid aminotransferase
MIETGARLIVSSIRRMPAEVLPPFAKTANYLNNILAYREAAENGADEALMLTTTEDVAEGSVSNIFLVKDGTLRTPSPDCGVMPGITRAAVIDVARAAGIPVREERIPVSELHGADEIFYTNTTAAVMPVGRIDARGLPAPGPITRRLCAGLLDAIEREAGRFWRAETG